MNGTLDKVRFWDRAMTEDEVGYRSYCELQGVSFGLKAKYNFNQGFSNHNNSGEATLYDSSGNSYNGSLTNFALQGISSNWTEHCPVSSGFNCYPGLTLNLKIIPQGFFNSNGQLNMRDTMKVYLHSTVSPYNAVDSAISVVDSITYEGIFNFVNSVNGNYYVSVKHRNSIETWSSYDEVFNFFSPTYYFFIYGPYSAYGNNLTPVGSSPTWFAIYSGDVNQDGVVDATDNGLIDNDAANFETGYRNTDLNGDNVIDASDAAIADNNASNFVTSIKP